ncbi:hypothetical protein EMCRGX_G012869 [Ephydatia muelleri]
MLISTADESDEETEAAIPEEAAEESTDDDGETKTMYPRLSITVIIRVQPAPVNNSGSDCYKVKEDVGYHYIKPNSPDVHVLEEDTIHSGVNLVPTYYHLRDVHETCGIRKLLTGQEDGSDRPIAYASRSLAPAEKNYSQIGKEGLAVVWSVKKFHQFLFGRQFVVYSDHKPLQFLFSETKPVPTMASSRIQRWALTLSAYNYQMVFRPGKNQGNADGLSRLPLAGGP